MASADGDLIAIPREEFRSRWTLLLNTPVPTSHLQRVEELRTAYPCFRIRQGPGGATQKGGGRGGKRNDAATEYPVARSMRPRIGALFTNRDEKTRKNFVAFMNKLSPSNKSDILPNFVRSLVPENIHIYMDQIVLLFQAQPTYHDLYMDVLHHVIAISPDQARAFLEDHFQHFMAEGYMVPDSILDGMEEMGSENTDQLCEYTKWKKKRRSVVVLYVHLLCNGIFGKREDMESLLLLFVRMCDENWDVPPVVDIYLDLILCAVHAVAKYMPRGIATMPRVVGHCKRWDMSKDRLKPSSKFKVMDILAATGNGTKK